MDVLESAPRDLLDNNSDKHIPAKVEKAGLWLEWLPARQSPPGNFNNTEADGTMVAFEA